LNARHGLELDAGGADDDPTWPRRHLPRPSITSGEPVIRTWGRQPARMKEMGRHSSGQNIKTPGMNHQGAMGKRGYTLLHMAAKPHRKRTQTLHASYTAHLWPSGDRGPASTRQPQEPRHLGPNSPGLQIRVQVAQRPTSRNLPAPAALPSGRNPPTGLNVDAQGEADVWSVAD